MNNYIIIHGVLDQMMVIAMVKRIYRTKLKRSFSPTDASRCGKSKFWKFVECSK